MIADPHRPRGPRGRHLRLVITKTSLQIICDGLKYESHARFLDIKPSSINAAVIILMGKTGCQKTKLTLIGLASRYIMEAVRVN